jgi:hypothetical protein
MTGRRRIGPPTFPIVSEEWSTVRGPEIASEVERSRLIGVSADGSPMKVIHLIFS